MDGSDPEPQLIAEAIAASYNKNDTRIRALGLPTLQNKLIPGVTMKGTMPTFYKILVTELRAGSTRRVPRARDCRLCPAVPRPARRYGAEFALPKRESAQFHALQALWHRAIREGNCQRPRD